MDVLSGLRNILRYRTGQDRTGQDKPKEKFENRFILTLMIFRSEDCRRLLCREGKRGGRFYHYLANSGVHLSRPASTALCNSL